MDFVKIKKGYKSSHRPEQLSTINNKTGCEHSSEISKEVSRIGLVPNFTSK